MGNCFNPKNREGNPSVIKETKYKKPQPIKYGLVGRYRLETTDETKKGELIMINYQKEENRYE